MGAEYSMDFTFKFKRYISLSQKKADQKSVEKFIE